MVVRDKVESGKGVLDDQPSFVCPETYPVLGSDQQELTRVWGVAIPNLCRHTVLVNKVIDTLIQVEVD